MVSVADQKLAVVVGGKVYRDYPISTSRYGEGDNWGSWRTPTGLLQIAGKIGASAPAGAVFSRRQVTGEVLPANAPGRDPIVTRILWLKGLEPQNRHAFARCIYIHGTPEERNVGRPASFWCVRMKSVDMLRVFNAVGVGATVEIIPGSLPDSLVPANNPRVVSGPIAAQQPPLPLAQAGVVSDSTPAPPVVAR